MLDLQSQINLNKPKPHASGGESSDSFKNSIKNQTFNTTYKNKLSSISTSVATEQHSSQLDRTLDKGRDSGVKKEKYEDKTSPEGEKTAAHDDSVNKGGKSKSLEDEDSSDKSNDDVNEEDVYLLADANNAKNNDLMLNNKKVSSEDTDVSNSDNIKNLLQNIDSILANKLSQLGDDDLDIDPIDTLEAKNISESRAFGGVKSDANLTGSSNISKTLQVTTNVNEPAWKDDFAAKVHVLINAKVKTANININPEELGPIKIQIQKTDSEIKVAFNSSTNRISELIETSLFKLRDLVESQGMNLVDVSVSSQEQQQGQEEHIASGATTGVDDENSAADNMEEKIITIKNNIIDFYA